MKRRSHGVSLGSRRDFLGGILSATVLSGCGLFRGRDYAAGGRRLRFGVVSDIHFAFDLNGIMPGYDAQTFTTALRWFRDQGVDAVIVCGDMADRSLVVELEAVAAAWFGVFPNDRAPDGRKVERVFVTGNHDWEGHTYGKLVSGMYPDEAVRATKVLRTDLPGHWKRIWGEDYETLFRKDVKGYAFIGHHWVGPGFSCLPPFLAKQRPTLDPDRPFFYVQHALPKGTVNGDWACGQDCGMTTKCLSAFPNAVAFSGHSHYSLTDERTIWQGSFTSIGASSLRYGYAGCEEFRNEKLMNRPLDFQNRQGMLVDVYDDCIVYGRREFLSGLALGDDWVQPLGTGARPFAFAERARAFGAPEFSASAVPTVACKGASLVVSIPQALGTSSRAYRYDVELVGSGNSVRKRVLSADFALPIGHPRAKIPTSCPFGAEEIPSGCRCVRVTPVSCFGVCGHPAETSV